MAPLWAQKAPPGHRPAGQHISKHSPESATDHIWTPKAVTACLPNTQARVTTVEGRTGRPLTLSCRAQTLSEALEAKAPAGIEQL